MYNVRLFKRITNFIFGAPTVESIMAPMSRMQDQLDELVFDNAVIASENEAVIEELCSINVALEKSSNDAVKKGDKLRELLA